MGLSGALSFLNRPWRTPLGKLVSFGIAVFFIYGTYSQFKEEMNAIEANGGEVRFDSTVEESEAQALAIYLVEKEYFIGRPSAVRLTKEDEVYHVQFVIREESQNDHSFDSTFTHLALGISKDVFSGVETVAHISDDELNNIREIPQVYLGELLDSEKVKLYYLPGVSKAYGEAVSSEFGKLAAPDAPQLLIQLDQVDGTFHVRFGADLDKVAGDSEIKASGIVFAKTLSADVFGGAPVEFHFTDPYFKPFLSVSSTEAAPAGEEEAVPAE
jgi:hypothetical protein